MISTLVAGALAAAAPQTDSRPAQWADCTIIEIRSDGTRNVTPPQRPGGAAAARGAESSSASASSSSASSSASATSDGRRRAITQTRDARGCVVTIDERP